MPAYEARMRQSRSLTSHRLFVPMVALWFGALFSLSSLAVSTSLFETMVLASGLDRLVPAASPPLGHTARLVIALVFGLIGAGIGQLLARMVAGSRRPSTRGNAFYPASTGPAVDPYFRVRARDAHPDAPARRPISAHDELGGEPLLANGTTADWPAGAIAPRHVDSRPGDVWARNDSDEPIVPPLPAWFRRNSPEATDAELVDAEPVEEATFEALPVAQVPGADVAVSEVPVAEPIVDAVFEPVTETVVEPVAAIAPFAEYHPAPEPAAAPVPEVETVAAEVVAEPEVAPAAAPAEADPQFPDAWRNTAERIARASPTALSQVELIERLAIALNQREATAALPGAPGGANGGGADGGEEPDTGGPDAAGTIKALRDALSTLRGA